MRPLPLSLPLGWEPSAGAGGGDVAAAARTAARMNAAETTIAMARAATRMMSFVLLACS